MVRRDENGKGIGGIDWRGHEEGGRVKKRRRRGRGRSREGEIE